MTPPVVLLGASNASRGIATICAILEQGWGPIHVHAAIGRSRAYSQRSAFLFQDLPGIVDSGLWKNLDTVQSPRCVVTDIGNDILYGAEVDVVVDAIRRCVRRLQALGGSVVLTRMPMHNVDRLRPGQLRYLQWLAPVGRKMSPEVLIGRARDLDAAIADLAAETGSAVVSQQASWYGRVDPIHYRIGAAGSAWAEILSAVSDEPLAAPARVRARDWASLQFAPNPERQILGVRSRHTGVSYTFPSGSSVRLF